ncbi:hypothetical protein [Arthrobacter sp. SX1312]|uniref:hypothetical protein n=1 Tax=Arthrobacter sp. SX1312 TaxID=2058896 RepID=UPI000CE2C5FC|nr:hypothetical protein [Arthrobacter sp. SX1312]
MAQTNTAASAKAAGAKTPDDKKKPRHKKSERFKWTSDDGDLLQAIYVENLPYSLVEGFAEIKDTEVQKVLINTILSEEDAATFRDLTVGEVMEFLEQWQEESSITLGEL